MPSVTATTIERAERAARDYLAREPGADNDEVRAYAAHCHGEPARRALGDVGRIRRGTGVMPEMTRSMPAEALGALCDYFAANPGAAEHEALAHLRREGMCSPGREWYERAREVGRRLAPVMRSSEQGR